ncbi:rhomboid family intramembrane serine protease [Nocardioides sp. IC4_145]|uniref:rhomboid family intramembrane serine protease n=1 Tax=Nocardioides sp. IC4_145 TaxID=2714037 RepID=UPI00140CAEE3|nr:rhomboid family intramembrane serine protease [Nocardioides sp. IC4_145]NHC24253.1 rhomboid family intramembrane serine protease [Nocardioides sp. IC4_145]
MSTRRGTREDVGGTWARAAVLSVGFVALLWLVEILDAVWSRNLEAYGVRPRDDEGLVGVALAPVLHGGWDHLSGNTVPVLVLGFLVLVGGTGRGLAATAVIWLVGGLGVWLTAPAYSIHLGASVLVFGWLVYLMVRGVFTRSAGEIILGIVLFLAYGGLLLGVLPGQPGVSWQGHLFGAVGGALAAAWVDRRERL